MPITPFLKDQVFDPDLVRAMGVAFERACQLLHLADKSDPVTKIVARRIIEFAAAGEHDPDKLYEAFANWLQDVPPLVA